MFKLVIQTKKAQQLMATFIKECKVITVPLVSRKVTKHASFQKTPRQPRKALWYWQYTWGTPLKAVLERAHWRQLKSARVQAHQKWAGPQQQSLCVENCKRTQRRKQIQAQTSRESTVPIDRSSNLYVSSLDKETKPEYKKVSFWDTAMVEHGMEEDVQPAKVALTGDFPLA